MDTAIISDYGVMLATDERLVVRGPKPRLELIVSSSCRILGYSLHRFFSHRASKGCQLRPIAPR
jgi:hypothetical protein